MTEEHTTTKNPLEGIDMGLNLRVARLRQKLTQTALLELTGIRQTDISAMENQEVIEDEESLVKLVKELGTTLEAIKETKAEDLLGGKAPPQYNKVEVTSPNDSKEVINQAYEQKNDIDQTYNYFTPELKAAHEALIAEKDIRIEELKKQIETLTNQVNRLIK